MRRGHKIPPRVSDKLSRCHLAKLLPHARIVGHMARVYHVESEVFAVCALQVDGDKRRRAKVETSLHHRAGNVRDLRHIIHDVIFRHEAAVLKIVQFQTSCRQALFVPHDIRLERDRIVVYRAQCPLPQDPLIRVFLRHFNISRVYL